MNISSNNEKRTNKLVPDIPFDEKLGVGEDDDTWGYDGYDIDSMKTQGDTHSHLMSAVCGGGYTNTTTSYSSATCGQHQRYFTRQAFSITF